MASSHLNFKKLLPFVLLGGIGSLEAKPAFFEITELANTSDPQGVLVAASPDSTLRETVSFSYSFGDYYRMTPQQMANPHAIDFTQGCIYSTSLCQYLKSGEVGDTESDSDAFVSGWLKVLMAPEQWLTSYFYKDSVNDGLVTAFAEDNQAMVGYFTEGNQNDEKFHSQRAFFRIKGAQRVVLPVTGTTGAGSVSRPSVVKKLENDVYLIGGTTSVAPVTDQLKDLVNSEKKTTLGYPGYRMQAAVWLVDSKNNQTYGPFLAEYIESSTSETTPQTASVQDLALVNNVWYAVGYSAASKYHRAVYWPLTVTSATQEIAFQASKTIDFEAGVPKNSSSTLWYTTAEHIREDGLIVGRVLYQRPENRNLPIKVFTYKLGDKKARFSFENAVNKGADHYITWLGTHDIALGRQDVSNQTYAAFDGNSRIAEAALFDLTTNTTIALNRLIGENGYQNGSYYRIDTPVTMMSDGSILAIAFKYADRDAYLGQVQAANNEREIVTVRLTSRAHSDYTGKSAESSLQSRLLPYLNAPFSPSFLLPVSGGLGCGALGFLLFMLYYRKKRY